MLAAVANEVTTIAINRWPDSDTVFLYTQTDVAPRTSRLTRTIPGKPPLRWAVAMKTSESHSQANQGSPARMNEKMSTAGTRPFSRIHSPVRICHPVSESVSSNPTPVVHQKSTRIGIKKAKSERDGRNGLYGWNDGAAPTSDCEPFSVAASSIVPLSWTRTGQLPRRR